MINKLTIAWRGYLRDPAFTGLNLLSLTIGLFVAYTAISYIRFELSYDAFHQQASSIYRLIRTYRSQDYSVVGFSRWDGATDKEQAQQLDALRKATGVVDAAQFIVSNVPAFLEANGRRIQATNLLTTNTPGAFCSLFTWTLQQGAFQDFTDGTNKAILTARTAHNLFGDDLTNAVQKRLKIGPDYYTVAAVIDDVPVNSHVDFTVALSKSRLPYWGSRVYIRVEENADSRTVTANINAAIASFNPKLAADPLYKQHYLQRLTDIHSTPGILYDLKPPGNRLYLILVGCFAVFICLITLFNYANLSLAIKSKQSKSIGMRKALGALTSSIVVQFMVEGVLLALLGLPLVAGLMAVCLPLFNHLMGVAIPTTLLANPQTLLILVSLAVVLGALSSSLTAVNLAWRNILTLFKDNLRGKQHGRFPVRNYLIVSQFVLLIGITAVSYFITKQINFVEHKDLGFRQEGILYAYSSPEKQTLFQQQLRQLPGIKAVGNGSSFGIEPFNQLTYKLQGSDVVFDDARQLYLDPSALTAYGLKTTLSKTGKLPEPFTLINRTAAEKLAANQHLPVDALIGKVIITEPEYVDENRRAGFPFTVAGIFEDINVFSLHQQVEPYFITVSGSLRMDGRTIIYYDPNTTAKTLAGIQAVYARLNEQSPLEIDYLSEQVAALYAQDRQTASLLVWFNLIAVLLAAIGIVGITVFLTMARTKEIGIRRVLGASPLSIMLSATREYTYLIGIAWLISWPIAAYVINKWLASFAYHIDIQQVAIITIGLLTFGFAAAIVALIAYRAALMNPVKSLRSE
ncbi:ABC transporter permease [Fibrella aquatilis]|uniref:ABC transporter permease n=1 Tax=Fibrella aquatilis TaxID=2817059 RepID=A0A939JVH1_9BACT|nr:ABC transporter permease [Fibrella aquatilis]MBO0930847.1 ABC transporter permease [Fibrella aquatilis]